MQSDLDPLRAAFSGDADRSSASDRCPPSEVFWNAARGELAPDALAPLLDHVSNCSACGEAWQLAVDLLPCLGDGVETDPAPMVPASGAWRRWVALAAAATIAVVVLPRFVTRGPDSSGDVYRTEATAAIRSLLSDGQPAAKDHLLLRWTSAGEGAKYSVEIATQDLTVVDRGANLTTSEYLVPERAVERFPSGTTLIWQVQATMPNGQTIRSVSFMIALQ